MTDKETLKLALDALTYKKWFCLGMGKPNDPRLEAAITALKERLAQPEQERDEILQAITDPENQPSQFGTVTLEYHQEKMKMWEDLFDRMRENFERISDKVLAERIVPLYTHPPQRTWVGLTDDEIALINADYPHPQGFARAIEAKLKEKNT
jgi:hypothetical protein